MAQPQAPLNQQPQGGELRDLYDLLKKDVFLSLNAHHVGTIQSFNATKQTATVSINYVKTHYDKDPVTDEYVPTLVSYPLLIDAPVVSLGGAGGALTFPIAKGDECLLLFNDRDISGWFAGSSNSALPTNNLHSFADAFVLVGVRSLANVLTNFDAARVVVRNGLNARIAIGTDHIQIEYGAVGGTLITLRIDSSGLTAVTGTGVSFAITPAGKMTFTNATGNFVNSIYQLFTDVASATAGGFPLVMPTFVTDLAILASFK